MVFLHAADACPGKLSGHCALTHASKKPNCKTLHEVKVQEKKTEKE